MTHLFFFFRQKTAYEMRISDWSSNVCSSDLAVGVAAIVVAVAVVVAVTVVVRRGDDRAERQADYARADGNGGGVVLVAVIVAGHRRAGADERGGGKGGAEGGLLENAHRPKLIRGAAGKGDVVPG